MTRAVLAALAAAAVLVGAYVALGGADRDAVARPPDPCAIRAAPPAAPAAPAQPGLERGIERVALAALTDAACALGVSRERLVLSVGGVRPLPPGIDDARREEAIRASIGRALDEEVRAGRLGEAEAALLRAGAQLVPIGELLEQLAGSAGGP